MYRSTWSAASTTSLQLVLGHRRERHLLGRNRAPLEAVLADDDHLPLLCNMRREQNRRLSARQGEVVDRAAALDDSTAETAGRRNDRRPRPLPAGSTV